MTPGAEVGALLSVVIRFGKSACRNPFSIGCRSNVQMLPRLCNPMGNLKPVAATAARGFPMSAQGVASLREISSAFECNPESVLYPRDDVASSGDLIALY